MKIAPTPIYKRFLDDHIQARRYFGLPDNGGKEHAWPTVTPFPVAVELVHQMIKALEASQHKSFIDIFIKGPRVTEFYLLYAYLEATFGGFEQFYASAPRTSFSLMASRAEAPEKAEDIIAKLERPDVFCFGVHRAVLQAKNPTIMRSVAAAWQRYGLVETEAEAHRFLTEIPIPNRRRFWIF